MDLDIGNSRCKWSLSYGGPGRISSGACSLESLLGGGVSDFGTRALNRIRVSTVRTESIEHLIRKWSIDRFAVSPEFATVESAKGGVTCGYNNPETLGVDRWLGMLAAYDEVKNAVCVVDCGSAITIDFVAANGEHMGGYIAPGLQLMRRSLLEHTDRIAFGDLGKSLALTPGRCTSDAVSSGTWLCVLGLLRAATAEFRTYTPNVDAEIVVTGGDGALFADALGTESHTIMRPNLVLDGLAIALP